MRYSRQNKILELIANNEIETQDKLASMTDELFIKTKQEAEAGAKIVFWSELNGAVLKQDEAVLL